jgi:predicted flap endonuclease-1-like 5' DNA nuclease/chromosome segregation ATPase
MAFNNNDINTDNPKAAASQLGKLHAELEDASGVTKDLYFKVADLQQQLAAAGRLDLELQDMQWQYDKLKSEEEQLKSQLQLAYSENVRYNEEFSDLEQQLRALHQQNTSLQKKFAHVEILDEEVRNAVLRNKELQQQVQRLNELESEVSIITEEKDILKRKKEAADLKVAELQKFKQEETLKFQEQLAHFAQLSRHLQNELQPLTEKIQQLQKEVYTAESWKFRYEESLAENELLRKNYHLLGNELQHLQKQVDEAGRRHEQEQLAHREQQLALGEIKQLQQQLNSTIARLAAAAAPATGSRQQMEQLKTSIQNLLQQLNPLLPVPPVPEPVPAAAPVPIADEFTIPAPTEASDKDDLRKINGISFTVEKLLNEFGYFYFWQLARLQAADMDLLKEQLQVNISNDIFEKWKAEARLHALAKGDGWRVE